MTKTYKECKFYQENSCGLKDRENCEIPCPKKNIKVREIPTIHFDREPVINARTEKKTES